MCQDKLAETHISLSLSLTLSLSFCLLTTQPEREKERARDRKKEKEIDNVWRVGEEVQCALEERQGLWGGGLRGKSYDET